MRHTPRPSALRTGVGAALLLLVFGCSRSELPSLDQPVQRWQLTGSVRIDLDSLGLGEVLVSENGRDLALADLSARRIVRFDTGGRVTYVLDRPGGGPGEFLSVEATGFAHDSLWVFDRRQRRTNVFGPDGRFVRAFSATTVAPDAGLPTGVLGLRLIRPVSLYADGDVLFEATVAEDPAQLRDGAPTHGAWLVRVAPTDSTAAPLRRTVARIPPDSGSYRAFPAEGQQIGGSVPFFARPLWAADHNGQRVAVVRTLESSDGPQIELVVLRASGDTILHRSLRFTPDPVTPFQRDSALGARLATASPQTRPLYEGPISRRIPAFHPPIRRVVLDPQGRIWLQRRLTDVTDHWLVLSAQGEPIASVRLAPRHALLAAGARHAWIGDYSADLPVVYKAQIDTLSGTVD